MEKHVISDSNKYSMQGKSSVGGREHGFWKMRVQLYIRNSKSGNITFWKDWSQILKRLQVPFLRRYWRLGKNPGSVPS